MRTPPHDVYPYCIGDCGGAITPRVDEDGLCPDCGGEVVLLVDHQVALVVTLALKAERGEALAAAVRQSQALTGDESMGDADNVHRALLAALEAWEQA